jgi:hypothetical protein
MLQQKIRHEFTKWPRKTSGIPDRESPDYLILATNTSVLATFGGGGREEIDAYIRHLSGAQFKDWLIWDEGDLLRMLDTSAKVRNVFVPIMTASRLAAELIESYRAK